MQKDDPWIAFEYLNAFCGFCALIISKTWHFANSGTTQRGPVTSWGKDPSCHPISAQMWCAVKPMTATRGASGDPRSTTQVAGVLSWRFLAMKHRVTNNRKASQKSIIIQLRISYSYMNCRENKSTNGFVDE